VKDIHDVIKLAKFGDDRLRGSGVVVGQISAFPIDFAGRPYNTLALPCERVIMCLSFTVFEIEPVICRQSPILTHPTCILRPRRGDPGRISRRSLASENWSPCYREVLFV